MNYIKKAPSVWALLRKWALPVFGYVSGAVSYLNGFKPGTVHAIVILTVIALYFVYRTQYKLASRDWKMHFLNDGSLHQQNKKEGHYPKLEDLLKHPEIRCAPLDAPVRTNKHIVQVGFVIVGRRPGHTEEKGILLIDREGKNHRFGRHKKTILVSFSPVPSRYEQQFDLLEIYAREIPSAYSSPPILTPLCIHPAAVRQGKECTHLFYIYVAEYAEPFTDERLKRLFYAGKQPFVKDHDGIAGIFTFNEICRCQELKELQGEADAAAVNALHSYLSAPRSESC